MVVKRLRGFTLVEVMIVTAIIGVIAAIAIPNFVNARLRAHATACVANLKQIDNAIQMWVVDTGAADSAPVVWGNIVPDYIRTQPSCPTHGEYNISIANTSPTCSVDNSTGFPHILQ